MRGRAEAGMRSGGGVTSGSVAGPRAASGEAPHGVRGRGGEGAVVGPAPRGFVEEEWKVRWIWRDGVISQR